MKTYLQQIKLHLSLGQLDQALALVGKLMEKESDFNSKWLLMSGRYHKNENDFALGILSRENYDLESNKIRYTINRLVEKNYTIWKDIVLDSLSNYDDHDARKDVFISYSHRNTALAMKVKDYLEGKDIIVQIDDYEMHPGIDVYKYISNAIKNSRFTLSIVSYDSLLSTWVAMETLGTFQVEAHEEVSRFIPCYIDKSFMDKGFTVKAIKQIDAELVALDQVIAEHSALKADTRNLNEDKSRLFSLRNNLDAIIGRLKRTKCMNISEAYFERNLEKIGERILLR